MVLVANRQKGPVPSVLWFTFETLTAEIWKGLRYASTCIEYQCKTKKNNVLLVSMTTGLYHLKLGRDTFNLDISRQKVCDVLKKKIIWASTITINVRGVGGASNSISDCKSKGWSLLLWGEPGRHCWEQTEEAESLVISFPPSVLCPQMTPQRVRAFWS